MADIVKQLDPFIAEETVKALSFTPPIDSLTGIPTVPTKNAPSAIVCRERRARLVQVLHSDFRLDAPPYLIISDGEACIYLFLPSLFFYDDESISALDAQKHHDITVFGSTINKNSVNRGALIKIRNYTIVSMSQCCKGFFSRLTTLPRRHHSVPIHPTVCWALVGCRAATTSAQYLPLIQVLGCDGSDIFGNPIDMHENIDFRRIIRQHTYDSMIQRLLACHLHYSRSFVPGSWIEWPYLQQKNRIKEIPTHNEHMQDRMQLTEIDLKQRKGVVSDQQKDDVRTTSHHTSDTHGNWDTSGSDVFVSTAKEDDRIINLSINTKEQEDLLSMYRSFETTQFSLELPNSPLPRPDLKSGCATSTSGRLKDTLTETFKTDSMVVNKVGVEVIDKSEPVQGEYSFATISEMLDDGSRESEVRTQKLSGSINDKRALMINMEETNQNTEYPIEEERSENRGIKRGFKWLQSRAKERPKFKFNYIVYDNDIK